MTPKLTTTPNKQTTTQATAVRIHPQGKTQHRIHGHPTHSGPGGKHQESVCQVWDTNTFQRQQDPETDVRQA